jgi:NarL family two-component system response regulator LiaR
MTLITILIADDHPVVREGLARMIELEDDMEIVGQASDGQEAIDKARVLSPRVVLMDVRMAGMGGVEATQLLRTACPESDVIVLSNYDEDRVVFDALRAGAKSYLLKDVSADRLTEAIRIVARGEAALNPAMMDRVMNEFRSLQEHSELPTDRLTPRESEVLQGLVDGLSNQELSAALVISEKTVKSHLTSIYRKLDVRDRSQAIVMAVRDGLATVAGREGAN